MHTRETITFEGIAPSGTSTPVPDGYDGFDWSHINAIDKSLIGGDHDGYRAALRGEAVGGTTNGGTIEFTSVTNFTLESGRFAAAWHVGLKVNFIALRDGVVVGHQRAELGQADAIITFNSHFQHIDTVQIVARGGHHGTGAGEGTNLAMENLKVVFDGAIPTAVSHHEVDPVGAVALMEQHDVIHGHNFGHGSLA